MKFNPGDVVKLKSGSPTMTVQSVGNYTSLGLTPGVLCVWFDTKGKNEAIFAPEMLKRYESPTHPEYAESD